MKVAIPKPKENRITVGVLMKKRGLLVEACTATSLSITNNMPKCA